MGKTGRWLVAAMVSALTASAAGAQMPGGSPDRGWQSWGGQSWVSEVRVGLIDHDPEGFTLRPQGVKADNEPGLDVNGEILFPSPDDAVFRTLLSPRPHLGAMVNSDGATSHVYGGLTWGYAFDFGLFIEGALGAALHNGDLHTPKDSNGGRCDAGTPGRFYCIDQRAAMGSRLVFREGIDVGFRFDGGHGLSAHLSHLSNAKLFDDTNGGLDFLGLRYGYRFGP